MRFSLYILTILGVFAGLFLGGCSGGQQDTFAGTTDASVRIIWPSRDASSDRLIPQAANSIQVQLVGPGNYRAAQTANRPKDGGFSTLNFTSVPAGTIIATATAYPEVGAAGVALATGTTTKNGVAGRTLEITVRMDSTIKALQISPATDICYVDEHHTFSVAATNADGDIVLTLPSNITWDTPDDALATINSITGEMVALHPGHVTITATETESGVQGTASIFIPPYKEIDRWGGFNGPWGIGMAADTHIFVTERAANQVQERTNNGGSVANWGVFGTSTGEFNQPCGLAISGNALYIADSGNTRVQQFNLLGAFQTAWGNSGMGNGQFTTPLCVAVDSDGNIYVTDFVNDNVQKFTSTGAYLTRWGTHGVGNGQFDGPTGIAIDGEDHIYVADAGNNRIQKFSSDGTYLTEWGHAGDEDGEFTGIAGLAVDTSGNLFAVDAGNSRIQKFTSEGVFITKFGLPGTDPGHLAQPKCLTIDADGNAYVTDFANNCVVKFAPVL